MTSQQNEAIRAQAGEAILPFTPDPFSVLLARIHNRSARIGIIGLGYVGLPLAQAFSDKGFSVLGFDVDREKVKRLRTGESYLEHLSSPVIREMLQRGFEATDDFTRLGEADAILICVPTPLTEAREPDLSYVVGSTESIGARLRRGQLVVLESTTYPTTTRNVVLPILERSGLRAGSDFFLAFSPEREDPGNASYRTQTIPKVVGGLEEKSLELANALYGAAVVRTVPVSTLEVAEACKILENTYRAVNIALVNELKIICDAMGIDVWEVIDAASTKPFGFQAFYPGPGLGGHCIPIDPFYLTWVARTHGLSTRFIELAGEINTAMPAYVVGKVADALNEAEKPVKGSRVMLLGMAYKKDVDDTRESPGLELMELLLHKGAAVCYNDPHIPSLGPTRRHPNLRMHSIPLTPESLREQDCVVVVTDHSSYDWPWIAQHARLIVDTRNATRRARAAQARIIAA